MMSAEIVICDNLEGLTTQGHKSIMHLSFHSQPAMLVSINYLTEDYRKVSKKKRIPSKVKYCGLWF